MADKPRTWVTPTEDPRVHTGPTIGEFPTPTKAQEVSTALSGGTAPSIDAANATLKPSDWTDTFRDYVAPFIRSLAVQGGRTIGSSLVPEAPVISGAAGGAAGDFIYQGVQHIAPRLFGGPAPNIGQALTEAGINTGIDTGLTNIPGATKAIANKLLKNMGPVNPKIPVQQALEASPDFPVSAGQATQSKLLTALEDVAAPHAKQVLQTQQKGILSNEARNVLDFITKGEFSGASREELPLVQTAGGTSQRAFTRYQSVKNSASARWNNFIQNEIPKTNETVYQPSVNGANPNAMFSPVQMQAPIRINNTFSFTKDVANKLEQEIAATENPITKSKLLELDRVLKPYANPAVAKTGEPVVSYLDAKNTMDVLDDIVNDKDIPPEVKRRVGLLGAIRNTLRSDINSSILGSNSVFPPSTQRAFNRAKEGTKALKSIFPDSGVVGDLLNPDKFETRTLQAALKNPEAAQAYARAVGSKQNLKAEMFAQMLQNSTDVNGFFHGGKGLGFIDKNKDVFNTVFNSNDRGSVVNLLRKMQAVDPKEVESGRVATAIRTAGAGLSVAGGIGSLILGSSHGVPTGAVTGGTVLTAIPLTKKAVETLLLNPTNARIIANLSHLPPTSYAAQSGIKTILKAVAKTGLEAIPYSSEIEKPQESSQ